MVHIFRFAFVSLSLPLSVKSVIVEQAVDFFPTHINIKNLSKAALIRPHTTTHQSWLPAAQRKQSVSCRGRFVQHCLPPLLSSSQTGAPRRTARKSTLVFIIWFCPLLHHPMETCNAGMPWRCSAHSLVRAESRASSPHPVSWGGAHVLLWSQPSFGLLVSTGDESVGARAGWLNIAVRDAWDPPPPHAHFLVSSSSTHDASFWRPWLLSRSATDANAADTDATRYVTEATGGSCGAAQMISFGNYDCLCDCWPR